jgi:hypothetical protein
MTSKFGKFPVNIRVVVAREAYKETVLQGPSAVVALPAACIGKYRALHRHYAIEGLPYQRRSSTNAADMGVLPLFINYPCSLHTFDRVLRKWSIDVARI